MRSSRSMHAHPPLAPVLRHRRQQAGNAPAVPLGKARIADPPGEEPDQRNQIEPGEPEVAHRRSEEQRQDAGVAVQPVVGDLAVAEEADDRNVAQAGRG